MGKKKEEILELSDSFVVVGADLSLNRPGFAVIEYSDGNIKLKKTISVDNKSKKENKSRGKILSEIEDAIKELCNQNCIIFFTREASVNNSFFGKRSGTAARTGISEVVGVSDLAVWKEKEQTWFELYPKSIKKLITGNGNATKEDVSKCLNDYVGDFEYLNDDESDATAVAVAWLIKNEKVKQVDYDNKKE